MSRLRLGILAGLAGALLFAVGVVATFPGDVAARYLAQQLEAGFGLPVALAPLRVTWRGLVADRLEVRTPGGLLALQDLRAGWSWRWFGGLPLEARIGAEGGVEAVWSWNGALAVSASAIQLRELPLRLAGDMRVTGRVDLNARLEAPQRGRPPGEIPQGRVDLRAEGIVIEGVKLAGTVLPPLRLDLIEGRGALGPVAKVETLTFRGDAEGNVSGTVAVNSARLEDSRLQLTLGLVVLGPWINQLGDLKPLAEGFLPGGRLDGTMEGTVAAPLFTRAAKRG